MSTDRKTLDERQQMTDLERLRHSCAHVMATAILRIWPDAQFAYGPPIENGFYYDFDMKHRITPDDFEKIEAEMKKIAKDNQKFEYKAISREEAKAMAESGRLGGLTERPGNPSRFKLDLIDKIPEGEQISCFQNGDFIDLCAGPHVGYTSKCKNVKLMSVSSSFYLGDESKGQLQRLYGTAFESKEAAGRTPQPPRRSEEARPPPPRQGTRAFPHRRNGRPGPDPLETERRARPPRAAGLHHRGTRQTGLLAGFHPAHRQARSLPHLRPLPLLSGKPVSGHRRARRAGKTRRRGRHLRHPHQRPVGRHLRRLPAQADELPAPHQDLRERPPLLPRPARSARRVRHRLPLGAIRRTRRHDPRPRLHPGRRPPLLHARTKSPPKSPAASTS